MVVRDADGTLRDLSWTPQADAEVTPVAADSDEGRSVIRHSAAHVLAQAVQELFPRRSWASGRHRRRFYYDFDVPAAFTPEDLQALEKRMRAIVRRASCSRGGSMNPKDDARRELAGEPYNSNWSTTSPGDADIMEVGGDELTAYDNLNPRTRERVWGDLCRGPHIPTTRYIPAFTLTRSSAAYWRGDQRNASLQRIYGTAWESQEALDRHLELLEERSAAIIASSALNSICSASPTNWVRACRFSTPRVVSFDANWRSTPVESTSRPATNSSTRRTSPRTALHHLRAPRVVRRRHVPTHAHRRRVRRGRLTAQTGAGLLPEADELPHAPPDLPVLGGPTANFRCGSSSSGRCTDTRSPGSSTD